MAVLSIGRHLPSKFMVFDVESVGLHGEGYAVGWVVIDDTGLELAACCHACDPLRAAGTPEGYRWIGENAPIPQSGYNLKYPTQVRTAFWNAWIRAKDIGAVLIADCGWPVEANFLSACVEDAPSSRSLEGPYPFHDVASVLMCAGMDPMKIYGREPNELPIHDPLADARQSARLLLAALKIIRCRNGG